jgi:hypothetical protein
VEATINEVAGQLIEGRGKTPTAHRTITVPIHILDELSAHLVRTGRHASSDLVLRAPAGARSGPRTSGSASTRWRLNLNGSTTRRSALSSGKPNWILPASTDLVNWQECAPSCS